MANTSVSVRSYTSADRRSTDRCSTAESYYKPGSVNSCSKSSTGSGREENLTPRLFLDRYSLPRVVRILPQEPVSDDSLDAGPLALFTGQLLMYRQYRSGKVEARSEVKTKHGSDLISLVVIPDTYQGWFSVVTERGQVKARCYNSIHRMVSAQVTAFLNMSDVVAYTHNNRTSADGTRQQYSKTNIRPGQVLKLLAVYQDLANQSTRSKRLSWPLIGRTEANRYAQCLTSTDQVLFIPVTTHGQFYAVATATNTTEDTVTKVYQLSKLLRTFPLPVRVCIITANKPQGSMLLESYRKEDVILTCILPTRDEDTTDTSQFRLLEIDVNSRFYVARAGKRDSDERRLFHSPPVQNALRFCRENGERWCRQLKVIHHIYPRENTVERKENTKPRKVSLGDKKTVKSASFRFSTSYLPEDLRPINRPLPRRPIESKPRPPIKQDYSYDSQHLYSKVAEETEEPISSRLPIESEHKTVWAKPMERSAEKNLRSITSENELRTKPERRNKGEEFKTKIVVHNNNQLPGFDENNYANNNAKYRVVRKTVNHQPTISAKPFFKTRVQIGADYSSGSDLPYSVVADQISTHDDNVYAEIGDTYPTSDVSYFSFDYQRRLRRYDYHHGGSDGTFSGTTTSSSNAEESSV